MKYVARFFLVLVSFLFWQSMVPENLDAQFSGGNGTVGTPYLIGTYADLKAMSDSVLSNAAYVSAYYRLTSNIDASASSGENSGAGFVPIGNVVTAFTGTFHGGSHTISNLTINRGSEDYIGLFGDLDGSGQIDSIGLVNVNITGRYYVGALVGQNTLGTITNGSSSGTVTGSQYVGGLIGLNQSTTSRCYSTCAVPGSTTNLGGLTGANDVNGNISNSYATGTVSGNPVTQIGGFVGWNLGTISNCYSGGTVGGGVGGNTIGGFVGYISGGTITQCYTTGAISSGGGSTGGFAGNQAGGTVSGCFWDQTVGYSVSAAGTGKTTTEMKTLSTFTGAGWDFVLETTNGTNDYWDMDTTNKIVNSGYPFLHWQNGGVVALPVELAGFTAVDLDGGVELKWTTATEVNNYSYSVERRDVRNEISTINQENGWISVASVKGAGTSNTPHEYSFVDNGLTSGLYSYRIKEIDRSGSFTYSKEVQVEVGSAPRTFSMSQNYPNPFNPSTIITYDVPKTSVVRVTVYDLLGRTVARLVNGERTPGQYRVEWNAEKMSSGIYYVRLETQGFIATRKLLLMK